MVFNKKLFQAEVLSFFSISLRLAAGQDEQPADFIQRFPGAEDAARDQLAPGVHHGGQGGDDPEDEGP